MMVFSAYLATDTIVYRFQDKIYHKKYIPAVQKESLHPKQFHAVSRSVFKTPQTKNFHRHWQHGSYNNTR